MATTSASAIRKLVAIVRLFRLQSGEMPMQQADILLVIAANPGITMAELGTATGLAQSSVSRNVAGLASYLKAGSPGLGFVEPRIDNRDPRRRLLFLTTQGRAFVQQLIGVLDPAALLGAPESRSAYREPEAAARSPRKAPANVKVPGIAGE